MVTTTEAKAKLSELELKSFSQQYLELLKGPLGGLNLTRIDEEGEFYNKQVLDSVLPFQQSEIFRECLQKTRLMIDVGFGGGLPILPMAKICPDTQFVGFEARGKKVEAVRFLADKLQLGNVQVFHKRLEEILVDRSAVITFKAVGKIIDCLNWIQVNDDQDQFVFFYKGPNLEELEGKDFKEIEKKWCVIEKIHLEIPGTEGRIFIGFQRKKHVNTQNVPRGTKKEKIIQTKLVNISDILHSS